MLCSDMIKTRYKLIIGAIVGFAVIGGIAALLLQYFELYSDMGQTVSKNPIQQQAVNMAQLSETYQAESARIISGFLAAAESGSADVAALASEAQKSMLALSLPPQYRQKHLSEVLLLGEIRDAAMSEQSAKASAKIAELKGIFDKDQ